MSSNQPDAVRTAEAQPVTALPVRDGQKSNQDSGRAPQGRDDLERIHGVTPEVKEALRRHGVISYDKLATYTPERLGHLLSVYDLTLPQYKLEMIIENARKHAQPRTDPGPSHSGAEVAPPYAKKRQFEKHWEKDWAELANFFISFGYETTKAGEKRLQTRAIYYEGETEQQWKNIAATQLIEWMLNMAGPSLPPEAETQAEVFPSAVTPLSSPAPTAPPLSEAPNLQISEINLSASNAPGSSVGKVRVAGALKLSDSLRESAENRIPYVTEAHLVDARTRQSTMVASSDNHLIPEKLAYEIDLDFPPPPIGLYQSYVIARLLPPGEGTVQVKGPIIKVEP